MALKFPDILQNNNSNYPLVDITEIRGNAFPVGLISETGSIPSDKRRVGAILFSTSSQQFYGFFGQTADSSDWNNPVNWKNLSSGSGTTITTTGGGIVTGSSGLSQTILGSLTVNEGVTANLTGTASWAASASNTPNALVTASVNINEITFTKGNGNQFTITVNTGSISSNLAASGSQGQVQWNDGGLLNGLSVLTYNGNTLFATGTFTGSFTGSFVGDIAGTSSATLYVTSSNVYGPYGSDSVLSSSYAVTASYAAVAQTLLGVLDSYPIILTGSTIYSYNSHRLNASISGGVFPDNNIVMGEQAGFVIDGSTARYTNMFGPRAGINSFESTDSNFFGFEAGANSISASNVFYVGAYSGKATTSTNNSTIIGYAAGEATSAPQSVFIGRFAGHRSGLSRNSIFIGRNAGRNVVLSDNSILLGFNVGNNAIGVQSGRVGIGRNNIIIGTNITLEDGRQDSINLGSILFASGTYYQADTDALIAPYSGTVNGKIGINIRMPQYTLDVSGSGNFYNGLTITGSIISSGSNYFTGSQFIIGNIEQTGSIYSTGSNIHNGTQTITGSIYTTGSNIFIGEQIVTGSLFTSGSNTLIGTTTLTGSLNISGSTTQIGDNTLLGNTLLTGSITISGSNQPGSLTASIQVYGDIRQAGYHRFDPVTTNIDSSITASYIYVSGSTNDLYFSQNGQGYANTTRLRWLEGNLYTGLLHGGVISASPGSTTFTITSGSGIIVFLNASTGSDPYPTIKYVDWPSLTNITPSFLTTKIQTFVGIDSGGAVVQRTEPWTDGLYNTSLQIGTVLHQNKSTINATLTYPNMAYGYKQRTYDFIKAFGPLKLSGYELLTSGTLGLTIGPGTAFSDGRNYQNDPNSPAFINDPGTNVSKIFRYYQSGSEFVQDTNNAAGYTFIDPTKYVDNSGSLQNVGNNDFSNQRVFWYPNSATKGIVVYYGTDSYADLDSAVLNAQYERFSEVENTKQNAVYLGTIVIKGGGDFTNANDYKILPSGIFRSVSGGGGTTINVTALASLSDVALSTPAFGDLLMYGNGSQWNNTKVLYGDYQITGSLSISGSLNATSSWATNASRSYAPISANDGVYVNTIYSTIPAISNYGGIDSIFLGLNAASETTEADFSIFLGTEAGMSASAASYSNFLGAGAGRYATDADYSNFLGTSAGQSASNAINSNFLGQGSGQNAINAEYSNFLGANAGTNATNARYSNFMGKGAGQNAVSASYSTLIGFFAGQSSTSSLSIGSNNIIIGTNISLPKNRKDSINIGGILFGTGSYSTTTGNPYTGSVDGKIGINVVNPSASLHVQGDFLQKGTASYEFIGTPVDVNNLYDWYGYNDTIFGGLSFGINSSYGITIISSTTASLVLNYDIESYFGYSLPHTWTDITLTDNSFNAQAINNPYYNNVSSITWYSQSFDGVYWTVFYSSSTSPGTVLPNNIYPTVNTSHGTFIASGSVYLPTLEKYSANSVLLYDSGSGKVYYTASSAIGGGAGTVTGTGTSGYMAYWSGSSTSLSSSVIYQSSTNNIGIGTANPAAKLDVSGSAIIRKNNETALALVGSGSINPIFVVYGSQGELFSVTDTLSGSLFSVRDINGRAVIESFSDSRTFIGNYEAPALYTTVKKTVNTGSAQVIYQIPTASYDSAYFDYNIRSGSVGRAGQIMAMWSSSVVNYTEVSASSFGNTDAFLFSLIVSGSNMVLSGSAPTNNWTVKTIVKSI